MADGATEIYWINGALEAEAMGNYVFLYTTSVDRSLLSITHESTGKEMRWDMELDYDYYPWTSTSEGSEVCYNSVISVEPTVVNDWEIRKEESIDGNCVTFADRDNVVIPNFLKNGDTWKIAVMEFGTYVCFGVGK